MSAVVRAPRTPTVLERIEEAIHWLAVEGIPLRVSGYGVLCTSSLVDVRWAKDERVYGCDALGAAVLMRQPSKTTLPDAVADALDISLPFEQGIADALADAVPSQAWSASLARGKYCGGYEFGVLLRVAILGRKYGPAIVREGR